ncbi:MAG: tetratricopeptide repeat protein [Acidobacteria bacterium]|nr:tetratricopeptide repeat protein [Acidobacteriota bacterium]
MRALSGASRTLAMLALVSVAAAGCGQWGQLKAQKVFKDANSAYQKQDYKKAAGLYEEVVANDPEKGLAYFFLGNSYDNQYKITSERIPENDALLEKAVVAYQTCADKTLNSADPNDQIYGRRALEYLALAYGTDKLNDPAKAEPVMIQLIQLDPAEPANYIALARLYEEAGVYDEAEKVLLMAKAAKPDDPAIYSVLANYYNRQGDFEHTIQALEEGAAKEPSNPVGPFTIATYYWDNAQSNFRLSSEQKMENVQKGLSSIDKAISLRPEYMEALVYKGLLLRTQANLEKDPDKQQALLKEAETLHDQAEEIRRRKATGAGTE